jgi:hypothetical protein
MAGSLTQQWWLLGSSTWGCRTCSMQGAW